MGTVAQKNSKICQKPFYLIMIAGYYGNTFFTLSSYGDPDIFFHTSFIIWFPQLFVKESRGYFCASNKSQLLE